MEVGEENKRKVLEEERFRARARAQAEAEIEAERSRPRKAKLKKAFTAIGASLLLLWSLGLLMEATRKAGESPVDARQTEDCFVTTAIANGKTRIPGFAKFDFSGRDLWVFVWEDEWISAAQRVRHSALTNLYALWQMCGGHSVFIYDVTKPRRIIGSARSIREKVRIDTQ